MRNYSVFAFLFIQFSLFSGNPGVNQRKIAWEGIRSEQFSEKEKIRFLSFKGATFGSNHIPQYFEHFKLAKGTRELDVKITDAVYAEMSPEESALVNVKENEIKISSGIGYEQKEPYALIRFVPVRKNVFSGKLEKLLSFNLVITPGPGMSTAKLVYPKSSSYTGSS